MKTNRRSPMHKCPQCAIGAFLAIALATPIGAMAEEAGPPPAGLTFSGVLAGSVQHAKTGEGNLQLDMFFGLPVGTGAMHMEVKAGTSPLANSVSANYSEAAGLVGEIVDANNRGTAAITQLYYEATPSFGKIDAGLVFSPGYLDKLGLGFEQLRADNPKLIQCAVTPFGQTGPWRDFKAGDLTHMAAGGFMALCGYDVADDPEQTPIAPGGGNAWHTACCFAYMAISAALVARDKSGAGQFIDLSVHDACAVSTEMHIPTYLYHDKVVIRQTGRHCQLTPNPIAQFRCADGKYVNAQGSRVPLRKFPDLVEWMDGYGLAEDLADPKYATAKGFNEYAAHIDSVIEKFAAAITRDELVHGGQARQFNWGAVCSPDELINDGHMADRGFWVTVDHPELGRQFTYPGSAAIHNGSPWRISRRAPLVGEHNGEIFSGELGVDKDELACLAEAGVL